ncbi:OX-2 membrane glycoprotein-like [Dromiciops gliroides]|uniref:OX-2 membrane glycoprotein-like n=1 Tax=Dromiciops gliroides TaxID=33562 RepID=UPI001CC497FE|nr:OX-2 membrane glycoprotein-like [Dromiciops gliroides]
MMLLVVCVALCFSGSLIAGMPSVIHKTEVTSTVGDNVTLSCQLSAEKEVLQVTWQKEGQRTDNIATNSPNYGPKLLGPYHEHVRVTQSDLNSSAITLEFVTLKDEGCYRCIFNIFPIGPVQGRMCLSVYAISKPEVDTQLLTSEEGEVLVVSCRVTGKPAPKITWDMPDGSVGTPQLSYVWHPNKTVTVISNFTYSHTQLSQEWLPMCVIHHPLLNTVVELEYPFHRPSDTKKTFLICFSSVIITFLFLGLYLCCLRKQKPGTHQGGEALILAFTWLIPKIRCGRFSSKVSATITEQQRTEDV